ncbi:MAG: class I SAM-dependent methyltransferase [Promethearchaeota archaeon]
MEDSLKNQDKKKRIIEKYNSTSYFYDKRYKSIQTEKFEIIFSNFKINSKLILDMGCGTGLIFEHLLKLILDKRVIRYNYVALDISRNMLLEFKSKVIKRDIKKISLNLVLSDIEFLPFRENIFNSIFSLTAFQNLPNIKNGIEELYMVGKNNADFKFSILKKNIQEENLINILKSKIEDLRLTKRDNLEDLVIQGKILKNKPF